MALKDDLLRANEGYARTFRWGDLPAPPARKLAVLTCMDARILPHAVLGLEAGDAHVIRNAGGRASDDALRSLIISAHELGTRQIAVIQHTRCGMLTFTNEEMQRKLRASTGVDVSHIDFLPIADLQASVREDVRHIRTSPLLPAGMTVQGFIYDVETGRLEPVDS